MLYETTNLYCNGNLEIRTFQENGKLRVVIKTPQKMVTISGDGEKRPQINVKSKK